MACALAEFCNRAPRLAKRPSRNRRFVARTASGGLAAIRLAKPMYSIDGRMNPKSAEAVENVLAGSLEKVRAANVDLSKTYTNQFVQ